MVQVEAWSASPFSGLLITGQWGPSWAAFADSKASTAIKIVVHRLRRRVVASTTEGKET
jgi:hypothetical protein